MAGFFGALVLIYVDSRFYFIEHQHIALGAAVVVPAIIFIILYLIRSRFAWHAAVVVLLMIVATLALAYQLDYMGFSLTWFVGIVDLLLFALMARFLWKAREPYLRYIAPKET